VEDKTMLKKLIQSILGVIIVWSIYCAIKSLISGDDLFGTNNDIKWGFLISSYAFLVSSIGACFIGSLGSVFKVKKYEYIEKRAIFLAIVIVLAGMAVIFVELGHPFRLFAGYISSPHITSPIWWMGVNYTLYLTFIILEFVFLLKDQQKSARIAGILALVLAVAAHSTVGSVFGVIQARPFWYGPYMPIDFILCAWILGFSIMVIVLFFDKDKIKSQPLLIEMGKWLAVLLVVNLFFIFWKVITALYSGEGGKYLSTIALLKGPLSVRFWLFEIIIGLIIPFILLVIESLKNGNAGIFVASILVIIGMFTNKINMVEAGQIVPLEIFKSTTYIKYSPTFTEISIVAGAIAFVLLFYSIFDKLYFAKVEEG